MCTNNKFDTCRTPPATFFSSFTNLQNAPNQIITGVPSWHLIEDIKQKFLVCRHEMLWINAKEPVRRSTLANMLGADTYSTSIFEFGAFASPNYDRAEPNVFYPDRLSTRNLRDSVGVTSKQDAVVPVDYVVSTNFNATIRRAFNLVSANHIVGKAPDVIGWLNRISRILTHHGHVFLPVPVKHIIFYTRKFT